MSKSMINSLVRPVMKVFKGPMGKVAAVGFSAVGGAIAEDFARKSGAVDLATGIAMDVLGIEREKLAVEPPASLAAPESPPPPLVEPPPVHTPPAISGVEVGCAGGACATKAPCKPCQVKTAIAGFVAAAKALPEFQGLVLEAKNANLDVRGMIPYPPFWLPDPPPPPAPPGAPKNPDSADITVTTPEGAHLHFNSLVDYKAWQRAQKAAAEQKKAAKRALDAKTKADQKRIDALKKRVQDQATAAQVAQLQAQVDQQNALNAQLAATPPLAAAPAAQQVVSTAAQGGDMSAMIQQIMQLKLLEGVLSPQQAQQQMTPWDGQAYYPGQQPMYASPDQMQQMYQPPYAQPGINENMSEDEMVRYSLGSDGAMLAGASDEDLESMFTTRGVAEDYEALMEGASLADLSSPELEEFTVPMPAPWEAVEETPVLDEEMEDCDACNQIW